VQQNFVRQSESQITSKNSIFVFFGWFGELNDLTLILKNTLQRPAIFWWMEDDGLGDVDGGVKNRLSELSWAGVWDHFMACLLVRAGSVLDFNKRTGSC
jgi:hypothetical protein